MSKKVNEECGIFGIFSPKVDNQIGYKTYLGLCALQHRGEESCGIAINENEFIRCKKDVGEVSSVFTDYEIEKMTGKMSIGQVKYSSTVSIKKENALPLVIRFKNGNMGIVYNGSLINSMELKRELQKNGVIFQSSSDAEVICSLIARARISCETIEEAVVKILPKLKGAYAFLIMTKHKLTAVRDPHGLKPLLIGKINDEIIFASESCALNTINATYIRDIKPGEVYCISHEKVTEQIHAPSTPKALCIFEYIYFARPDSYIDGVSVHDFRVETGKYLAKKNKIIADIVCGVPDSGLDAAIGYSQESGIPYELAFIKNKYIGRTFIKPKQSERQKLLNIKLNVLKSAIKGKKIVLIDDSIVRGTTMGPIIKQLKQAGAKEVHLRISSPSFIDICYFGSDITNKDNLIATKMTKEEIKNHVGADSLEFLELNDLDEIAKKYGINGYCAGCFTSKYPMRVPEKIEKDIFEEIF